MYSDQTVPQSSHRAALELKCWAAKNIRATSEMLRYGLILILVSLSACGAQLESPFTSEHRTRAEESFNASSLNNSLEQILQWHQLNQTELGPILNTGKDESAVLEELSDLPCQPTEELIQLWGWHNGTKDETVPFIWYHHFLSVEKAKTEYNSLLKNPLIGWQKNWIPVFEFEGEWYFVECYEEAKQASPVGYYFLEDTEAHYVYLSLSKMLETSAASFNQNVVRWDKEEQGMTEDVKKVYEIQQAINTGTQFPYYVE